RVECPRPTRERTIHDTTPHRPGSGRRDAGGPKDGTRMLNTLEYVREKKVSVARPHPRGARVARGRSHADRTDDELVSLAQAGNTRAFDELIRRYRDRVYRLAYRILRHEEDAADSAQDAFLSAYRGLKSFKGDSAFSTWLYRIASNASL